MCTRTIPPLWATLALALVGFVLAGCGGHASRSHSTPVVLVDAQGQCPFHGPWNGSEMCRTSREGAANAVTPNFHFPLVAWGIAYAFRCSRPDGFYVTVGMPGQDGFMPDTHIYRHGLGGRGYFMETGRGVATYKSTPEIWRNPENLQVDSACAWHVRAVLGKADVVSRSVPPVPAISRQS